MSTVLFTVLNSPCIVPAHSKVVAVLYSHDVAPSNVRRSRFLYLTANPPMVSPQELGKVEQDDDWITISLKWVEDKIKQEPPTPKPTGIILEGTSQGGRYDKPPDDWIRSELVEFGALDTKVQPAALRGEIHPMFRRQRWPYIDDQRFDALQQSFLLSTKLLAVAAPYLTSFIPETKYQAPPNEHRIALNPDPSQSELSWIRTELETIAPTVHFEEDPDMWPSPKGWLGITHTGIGRPEKSFEPEDESQFRRADRRDKAAGHSHRQLTVGLASQFADVLVGSKPGSEEHLRAAFMAGITLTHEIGHVVHNRQFKHETWWGEPCVGQDIQRELGNALIAWLFNGWTPGPIDMGKDQRADMRAFKTGICWNKQLRRPILQPLFSTVYSMPMAHIQRIMTQEVWDSFDPVQDPWKVRQELLSPKTPFKRGEHARMAWKINITSWERSGSYTGYEARDEDEVEAYEDPDWEDSSIEPKERHRTGESGKSSASVQKESSATNERKGSRTERTRQQKPESKENQKSPSTWPLATKSKPKSASKSKSEPRLPTSKPPPVSLSSSSGGKRKRKDMLSAKPLEEQGQTKRRKSRRLAGLSPEAKPA